MDPNFKEVHEEGPSNQSYLSRAYNAMPNMGIQDYFKSKKRPITPPEFREHISDGMKHHHPEVNQQRPKSFSDQFVDQMLGQHNGLSANHSSSMEFDDPNEQFYDARDSYEPEEEFYDAKENFASGGYTGNIGDDEFVHRRHHQVSQPDSLDEMIRAYIAHMMQEQAAAGQGQEGGE
jgi:hypothetical protein